MDLTNEQRISPWMTTGEAARYLGAKAGTLKNWRHRGEGPRYHIVNRRLVRYHQSELDAFARHEAGAAIAITARDQRSARFGRAG